jgi:hypothetical protein
MFGGMNVRDIWMIILGFTIGLGIGYVTILGIFQPEIFRLQDELRSSDEFCEADSIMFYLADSALFFIEENHPEVGLSIPQNVPWQGGRTTPDDVTNHETYVYRGQGWKVSIEWDIVNFESITYNIVIEHDSLVWSGEVSRGVIKEFSFTF